MSIPLVIFGATLLVKVMERWPIIITVGAGLLGFVAGEMAWEDGAVSALTEPYPPMFKYGAALIGAAFVVIVGRILARRSLERAAEEQVENLAEVSDPGGTVVKSFDHSRRDS